jgi:hypothetical protein
MHAKQTALVRVGPGFELASKRREESMRLTSCAFVLTGLSLILFASSANAQEPGKGKKKRAEAEKVEIKDVPAAVADAAKKELPNAQFTSAQKQSHKKRGTLYTLAGKDGKYQVSVMLTSSGELQRLTKGVESRKKKGL